MKLEYYNQGASGSAVATIEPAGPGASRLTISHVKAGADDGQGVALRFKDFKDGTLIEGTPDPAYAMPLPGGRIDDLVFNLGDEVTNALVRNLGSNNTICVEADGIGDVRTLVAGELKLGADKPKAAPAQPFASAAPEAPQAAPAAATSAAPVQKKGRGALIAIIIAILLLLAIAAFAAWWFLLRQPAADAAALPDAAKQEQAALAQDAQKADGNKAGDQADVQDQANAQGAGADAANAQDGSSQQGSQGDQGAANAQDQAQQPQQLQDQQAKGQQDQQAQDQQPQGSVVDGSAMGQNANAAKAASGQAVGGQASGATGPCTVAANSDDQALLKGCLATKPSDQDLMGLAKDALSNKRCDVGTRLLTSLGRSGKQDFSLYYAKLADPNTRDASACIKKDAASAKYWYQKALDAGNSDEAKQALEKLK